MALSLPLASSFANINTVSQKASELQQLKHLIQNLKQKLSFSHHKKLTLQQQLRENEITAGNIAIQIRNTNHDLQHLKVQLVLLHRQQNYYENRLKQQQQDLINQMQTVYKLGNQTFLKMLLNHEDPSQISRTFVYFSYLQKARIKTIKAIEYTLHRIKINRIAIQKKTAELQKLQEVLKQQYAKQQNLKTKRTKLLQVISARINTQQKKLQDLVANRKALEKLIAKLKAEEASTIFGSKLGTSHHKLAWPAKGKIEDLYGSPIGQSELKWNGDVIYAPVGTNVYAIDNGKVVFSQWLQGYGLLLIIDHGHGYMSLYGRNNSLYKKVGDVVQRGDLIATVGTSGGFSKSSLYFAIRHNGDPVNPSEWCHS